MLIITCTSGRPKALEALLKYSIEPQTVDDYEHLIVCDDSEGYRLPKNKKTTVIKREHDENGPPSICQNYAAALDYLEQSKHQKAVIFEDDDFFHERYLALTNKQLDRADLFGWQCDAYYYVLYRQAKRLLNVGFAALASTAFTRNALAWVKECVQLGTPEIDLAIWEGFKTPQGQLKQFRGSKLLVDNFSGIDADSPQPKKIDPKTGLAVEFPRHVGLKGNWHKGKQHASVFGHTPHGGIDHEGHLLRKWIGDTAADYYLSFTRTPQPGPDNPFVILPMSSAEDNLPG